MSATPLWLLINLDRSTDRLATMRAHLDGLGVTFTRVPAVDGRNLPHDLPGIDPALFLRCQGQKLRPADAGCYLSHLRAMARFLASSAQTAMILEDDVELTSDAVRLAEQLAREPARDWDMVKFESHRAGNPLPIRTLFGPYRLAAAMTRTSGTAAYLVNRHAAAAYLDRLLPMAVPLDHAFDRAWPLGLKIRIVTPRPARAEGGANAARTTIGTERPEKVHGLKKLPVLLWRARTEAMRVVSALCASLFPTRVLPWLTPRSRRHLYEAAEAAILTAAPHELSAG